MKTAKFFVMILILFFSILCAMIMEQFYYDTPTPELYQYMDKTICLYPAYELDPDFEKTMFHEPAIKYFSPQFKAVKFASGKEEAKNVQENFTWI
ncbi:MAG: hypothetical protein ACOC5F_04250 [Candidatus Aminicenantaceae bacterium]